MTSIRREDWAELAAAFTEFFAGAGEVSVGEDALRFSGPAAGTGLELRRDGTSSSFMPLHGLDARWDQVRFDRENDQVVLEGDGVSYNYRVPPSLRS
ncbi:MAG: hypothetical protein HKN91_17040 [Acidimicrobiia bacterium]|nr:hypothetical protein [Acidimicrobiia bacterium]